MSLELSTLTVQLEQPETFVNIIRVIQQWTSLTVLQCNSDGMAIQAMDGCNVSLVQMELSRNFFGQYSCTDSIAIGINIEALMKLLKCCDLSKRLIIETKMGSDVLYIRSATSLVFLRQTNLSKISVQIGTIVLVN